MDERGFYVCLCVLESERSVCMNNRFYRASEDIACKALEG